MNEPVLNSATAPNAVSYWSAFWYWLRLGFISFGGPAGQIAIMHRELVDERRWISEGRFLHALNYCMLLPGPEAQQLATYIGWLMHRTWGGITAGALFVLPSWFIMVGLSWVYVRFGTLPLVAGVFAGLKPAVVALVVHAAYRIGSRALTNITLWAIAVAAFVAIAVLQAPFPYVIGAAMAFGAICGKLAPTLFVTSTAHARHASAVGQALIDDDTPRVAHTRYRLRNLLLVLVVGAALWFAPMVLLVKLEGWNTQYAQLAWFFTKAALLTFGGAYAVLPYVYQGAVLHYGWLSGAQMIDGLALGETTPGPLIMVVTFVGFIAGYESGPLATSSPLLSGIVAATVVTWFTFLPSFIFILAGGPLVESTRNEAKFTAPLTAVTAAVVGVILSLALFFARHVLWHGALNLFATAIAITTFLALQRYKVNVMLVLGAAAALGVIGQLAGL